MFIGAGVTAVRNVQNNYKFVYHIVDSDGDHVSGQTVTLQIQEASTGNWYDFTDDDFVSSGWTDKTTNLTDDTTDGLYHYTFNPPSSERFTEQYIFLIDNGSTLYGDHQSLSVTYQNFKKYRGR